MVDITTRWLRGAVTFGLAGIVAAISHVVDQQFGFLSIWVTGFVLSGCIGGSLWASSAPRPTSRLRGAVAFGVGFLIPGIAIPFYQFRMPFENAFLGQAICWGLSLGLGAALAGLILLLSDSTPRIGVPLAATFAFLIGGLTGGSVAFALPRLAGDLASDLLASSLV